MRWHRMASLLFVAAVGLALPACADDPDAADLDSGGDSTGDQAEETAQPEPADDDGSDGDDDGSARSAAEDTQRRLADDEPAQDDSADTGDHDTGDHDTGPTTVDTPDVDFPVNAPLTDEEAQAVLTEIDRLDIEALTLYLDSGEITDPVLDAIRNAYADTAAAIRVQSLHDIHEGTLTPEFEDPPAPRTSIFERFVDNTDTCVHVEVTLHRDGKVVDPPDPTTSFIVLEPRDPADTNETGWVLTRLYTPGDGEPEVELCE